MSRKDHNTARWKDEIKQFGGLENAILDRLKFHKGLFLSTMVREYGRCANTIKKHCKRLEARGLVTVYESREDVYYTYAGE